MDDSHLLITGSDPPVRFEKACEMVVHRIPNDRMTVASQTQQAARAIQGRLPLK
jgi:hypothetical protein